MSYELAQLVQGVEEVEFEQNTFLVQSSSCSGAKYKVCLDDFDGNGSCCCTRFLEFGMLRDLENGRKPCIGTECFRQ